ncbi:hypothetical protein ABZP36_022774 [Zizania latifolia]
MDGATAGEKRTACGVPLRWRGDPVVGRHPTSRGAPCAGTEMVWAAYYAGDLDLLAKTQMRLSTKPSPAEDPFLSRSGPKCSAALPAVLRRGEFPPSPPSRLNFGLVVPFSAGIAEYSETSILSDWTEPPSLKPASAFITTMTSSVLRRKLFGRCFRCFSKEHFMNECRDPIKCIRCHSFGHKAKDCSRPPIYPSRSRSASIPHPPNIRCTSSFPPLPHLVKMDPIRLLKSSITLDHAEHRLQRHAAFAIVVGHRSASSTGHVKLRLTEYLRIQPSDAEVFVHPGGSYMFYFTRAEDHTVALSETRLQLRGLDLKLIPWTRCAQASFVKLHFRARLCLEGIPRHAWNSDTAALILSDGCLLDKVDDSGLLEKEAACFCVWVWTQDPIRIPKSACLQVAEPDEHLSPPRNFPELDDDVPRKHSFSWEFSILDGETTAFRPSAREQLGSYRRDRSRSRDRSGDQPPRRDGSSHRQHDATRDGVLGRGPSRHGEDRSRIGHRPNRHQEGRRHADRSAPSRSLSGLDWSGPESPRRSRSRSPPLWFRELAAGRGHLGLSSSTAPLFVTPPSSEDVLASSMTLLLRPPLQDSSDLDPMLEECRWKEATESGLNAALKLLPSPMSSSLGMVSFLADSSVQVSLPAGLQTHPEQEGLCNSPLESPPASPMLHHLPSVQPALSSDAAVSTFQQATEPLTDFLHSAFLQVGSPLADSPPPLIPPSQQTSNIRRSARLASKPAMDTIQKAQIHLMRKMGFSNLMKAPPSKPLRSI